MSSSSEKPTSPLNVTKNSVTFASADAASSSKTCKPTPAMTTSDGNITKSAVGVGCCKHSWSLAGLDRALPETLLDLTVCRSSDPLQFMTQRLYHSFNVKMCHDDRAAFPVAMEETMRELESERTKRQQRMDYCRVKIQEYQKVLAKPAKTATKSKLSMRHKRLKKKMQKMSVDEEEEEEEYEETDTS